MGHINHNMFRRMFGGDGNKPPVSASSAHRTVEAIQKLGETEELLMKRQALLEKKISQETEKAREYTRLKNKRAALMSLKKRKLYEAQMEGVENNIMRINEQQMMLENQRTTVEAVSALSNAAKASKQTMHEMKVDDVDDVLANINEQNENMEQINAAMGQPIGPSADIDEDDLLAEFEEMEASQLDEELLEPAAVPQSRVPAQTQAAAQPQARAQPQAVAVGSSSMPSVPAGRHKAQPKQSQAEIDIARELEELEIDMASA